METSLRTTFIDSSSVLKSLQFATEKDRFYGKCFDKYMQWLVQDQTLFAWLLSTISGGIFFTSYSMPSYFSGLGQDSQIFQFRSKSFNSS